MPTAKFSNKIIISLERTGGSRSVTEGSVFVFYTDQNTDPDTGFFLTLSDVIKKNFPTAKSLKMVGSLERTVHISYNSLMQ